MRKPAKRKHSISLSMIFLPLVLLVFGSINASSSNLEKMKPEELVAKHLESIAPAQALAKIKTRIIAGTSQVIFRTDPEGQASGRAVLASEGRKNLLGMSFPTPVYPREQLVFDGDNFVAAFVTPGVRSVLGNFLMTNQAIFKQGLMGGTLSSAWPLLNAASKGAQLEYAGTRNVDNKVLHVLKYVPRGGSDVKITLLFDQDSFQHVRTEYERVIPAQMDTRSYTNVQTRESRYKMIEEFSSFKKEGELMLPHTYKIRLAVDTQGGTFLADWTINLTQFTFNEKIDPAAFNASAN
jgi:hypothetical protein